MEKKISIERIALIIGTILGVISFFWQVYDSVEKQKEKVSAEITFKIPKEDLLIDLIVTVVNYGQRPVYIDTIFIHSVNINLDDKLVFALIEYDKNQTDPIQPGQSREFKTQISYQSLQNWFASKNQIYLTIESPTQKIFEKSINGCIENANRAAKYLKEDRSSILSSNASICTP